MKNNISLIELDVPALEFGGIGEYTNPREGLREAGPFDLRFGAAHRGQIRLGFIGPKASINLARTWFERCQGFIESHSPGAVQYPCYDGFAKIFKSELVFDDRYCISFEDSYPDFNSKLKIKNEYKKFEEVLSIYKDAMFELASAQIGKPDIVICCIPKIVSKECWSTSRSVSPEEQKAAEEIIRKKSNDQFDWIDALEPIPVEEIEEYLLTRDFRRALKAYAMHIQMPVQLASDDLYDDSKGQPPAEKAWNISVGLYYKSGGIPWRLKNRGPETCFVGITFHHFKTNQRHIVRSSVAHAFSTEGEGFALKGQGVPWEQAQGRNVHLTEDQAFNLGQQILEEYEARTGGYPVKIVLHKSSAYDENEIKGFKQAFREIAIVDLINLMRTPFRLVRLGEYPVNRGTVCTVNDKDAYLFTTGFMPELGTYPGPHIPAPIELRSVDDTDLVAAAQDIMGLTRMNWNTASVTGGAPVTLQFSSKVGGIMDEYGFDEIPLSSFRYYM